MDGAPDFSNGRCVSCLVEHRRRKGVSGPRQAGVEHCEFGWGLDLPVVPEGNENQQSALLDGFGVRSSWLHPGKVTRLGGLLM